MDRRAVIFISVAALGAFALAALGACNLQDFVEVDIPKGARAALGIPIDERITVADSEQIWTDWLDWVDRESVRLSREIDEGWHRYEVMSDLASMGFDALEGQVAGVPFGPFIVAGLGGLGGLFLKRPGDRKREQNREVAAYRAGAASVTPRGVE